MTENEKQAYSAVRGEFAEDIETVGGCDENGCNIEHLLIEADNSEGGCFVRDSGARTEFPSGAVRDMREGKGRCDLMPLEVVAAYIQTHMSESEALVLYNIAYFQYGHDITYLDRALDIFCRIHPDYMSNIPTMFLEVAKQFEDGAKKYGDSNWQKGVHIYCYIDSAVRHYLKWLRGDHDEPHDRAFVWNILCCIWEAGYSPRAAAFADDKEDAV